MSITSSPFHLVSAPTVPSGVAGINFEDPDAIPSSISIRVTSIIGEYILA